MKDVVTLEPEVAAMAAAVRADANGLFRIADTDLLSLAASCASAKPNRRRAMAEHILALMLKYQNLDAQRMQPALEQLTVLFLMVAGDLARGVRALEKAGQPVSKEALAAVGRVKESIKPVKRAPGGLSVLDVRSIPRKK